MKMYSLILKRKKKKKNFSGVVRTCFSSPGCLYSFNLKLRIITLCSPSLEKSDEIKKHQNVTQSNNQALRGDCHLQLKLWIH